MMLNTRDYIKKYKAMCEIQHWDIQAEVRKTINQSYICNRNLEGMNRFYQEALKICCSNELKDKVHFLENEIGKLDNVLLLKKIKEQIKENIIAIYFEYGDLTLDCFLCESFDEKDDFWASEYFTYIEGYSIEKIFEFYDWDLSNLQEVIMSDYVDSLILKKLINDCSNTGLIGELNIGFSAHENSIILF